MASRYTWLATSWGLQSGPARASKVSKLLRSTPWPAQLPRLSSAMPVAAAIGTTIPRFGSFISQHGVRVTRYSGRVDWSRPASRTSSNEVEVVVFSRTLLVPSAATRVAAARCCGWLRSLPIGILHRQLLGMGVRPGVCPGPADRPDLVLGGMLGVVPGLLLDHPAVQHSPGRRGGRGHRSWEPAVTRPTCRGAGVTGGFNHHQ